MTDRLATEGVSLRGAPRVVQILLLLGALCVLIDLASVLPGAPGRPAAIDWIDVGVYHGGMFLCLLASLARALLVPRERVTWLVVGSSQLVYVAASFGWTLMSAHNPKPQYLSVFHIGLLAFYPLGYAALVLLLRDRVSRFRRSMWMDGLVAGLLAGAVAVGLVFETPLMAGVGDPTSLVVNLLFPVGDVAMIILVIMGVGAEGWRLTWSWALLGSGLAIKTLADGIFLLQSADNSYHVGSLIDPLWPLAMLLISLAAWSSVRRPTAPPSEMRQLVMPLLAAVVALGNLTWLAMRSGENLIGALLSAAAVAVLFARTAMGLRDASQLTHAQRLAMTDDLTGLPNRRALNHSLARRVSSDEPMGLVLIDLDGFKELNDTLGHDVGDELLRAVGARLSDSLHGDDLFARLGGDEFAVLLGQVSQTKDADRVAVRMREALAEPFMLAGIPVRVDASFGTSVFPGLASSATELLKQADVAMYQAKRTGVGIASYESRRDMHSRDRLVLLGGLGAGIARGEIVLHYQPQVDAGTGQLTGLEALARWQHPALGLLTPETFLVAVEHTSLIKPFTERVLTDSVRAALAWTGTALEVPISVNVAACNLMDLSFPLMVHRLLAKTGLPANRLHLEVTENGVMTDAETAVTVLSALRAEGVEVHIDDFGTGYSSLERIKTLPVDGLKVDRQFVMNMRGDERDAAIVEAAITLGRRLNLTVTAEGIEDLATLRTVAELGCTRVQGFLIGRPMPAAELTAWMREHEARRRTLFRHADSHHISLIGG